MTRRGFARTDGQEVSLTLAAERSAVVSRGVASDSQHRNGNAMEISMPGVPVLKVRQVARSLGMSSRPVFPTLRSRRQLI